MESMSFLPAGWRNALLRPVTHRDTTQGLPMTTVAQLNQPLRPIAVGNRQLRFAARHCVPRRDSIHFHSTFPSLVGSFGSRLEVGNRQPSLLYSARHITARRFVSRSPTSQRIPNPIATAFVRSLVGLSCYDATLDSDPHHTSPQHSIPHHISTNTACQAATAFWRSSVRRNQIAATQQYATLRVLPPRKNTSPQRPPFGAASPTSGLPGFRDAVTGITTTRVIALRITRRRIATQPPATPQEETTHGI